MRMKKMMAAVLAAVMMMSTAGSTLAAPSPVTPPTPTTPTATTPAATPSVDGYIDNNTKDHTANEVVSVINKDLATVLTATSTGSEGKQLALSVATNSKGESVPITVIGDGKKGVFNSKKGRKVTTVQLSSANAVLVKKLAFKGSKVKTIKINTDVTLSKNSFKGTKQKKVTLSFKTKKASSLTLKKGALKGLKKVTVKGLSKAEYKKLLKKAKKAGIKTSIFKRG